MPATEVLAIDAANPDTASITRAAECLRRGGLVAFPTETVYGLGVHALDRDAVLRLFAAKGRPSNDPLIVHVSGVGDVPALVAGVPEEFPALAARFWPGPLTVVLPRSPRVPSEVCAGLDTVAIRVPAHPVARALIAAAEIPVAAPSANIFSRPSPTRAEHVLTDLDGRIDMVLDAGPTHVGVESTVVDLSSRPATVLRPGAVSLEMLREIVPDVSVRPPALGGSEAMASPGLLPKHYAPRTPLTVFRGTGAATREALIARARRCTAEGVQVVVLALREDAGTLRAALSGSTGWTILEIGSADDERQTAQRLYAALREADEAGAGAILVRDTFTARGLGLAIRDRLQRAAAHIEAV